MAAMSEVRRFESFCQLVGLELEPFQRRTMQAVLSDRREVVVSQPRGNGKTTLLGLYGLYELVRHPEATIICAAAARDQAQHLFRAAERFAKQLPELRDQLTFTLREIRTPAGGRLIVVSADAEKQMGHDPYLVIVDELGSHTDDRLYVSLRSALIKRPEARMRVVSTMGGHEDAPMPTMRRRVLEEGKVTRRGAVLRAETRDSLWLEWAVPEGADIDDIAAVVKPANPRKAITVDALAEHRRVLHEHAFRRLHCNQHLPGSAAYIAADEWDANAGAPELDGPGFKAIGIDAAVASDSCALALVRRDPAGVYHVLWRVWTPSKRDRVPLADVEAVAHEWAQRHEVDVVVYDPRFAEGMAQSLEDAGVPVKPWVYKRNAGAAAAFLEVVKAHRLRHGGADLPRRHALAAEVRDREYGQVVSKMKSREHTDALMAALYAVAELAAMKPARRSIYEDRELSVAA